MCQVSLPALGLGRLAGKAGRLPPLRPPLSPTNRHPNQPSPEPRLHWVYPSTVSWVLQVYKYPNLRVYLFRICKPSQMILGGVPGK